MCGCYIDTRRARANKILMLFMRIYYIACWKMMSLIASIAIVFVFLCPIIETGRVYLVEDDVYDILTG